MKRKVRLNPTAIGKLSATLAILTALNHIAVSPLFCDYEYTKEEILEKPEPAAIDRFVTPSCKPHPSHCEGLCSTVSTFVQEERKLHLTTKDSWGAYYKSVHEYYRCVNAKIIVEVGIAYGSQTAYHLKHGRDFIKEYHVVDPFLAGYDKGDAASRKFQEAAPGASPKDISLAWFQGIAFDIGSNGMYVPGNETSKIHPAPGCRLRMHHVTSVEGAKLFGDHSVDAVFIDGLHTYEGVLDDIYAWMSKIKVGGSLIFNDFNKINFGVNKAVWEVVEKHNLNLKMIDETNAVLSSDNCAKGLMPKKFKSSRLRRTINH